MRSILSITYAQINNRPPIDSGNVTRAVRNWSLAELMGLLERRGGSMKQLFNTFRFLWAWAFIFGSGYAPYLCALAVYNLWRGLAPQPIAFTLTQ